MDSAGVVVEAVRFIRSVVTPLLPSPRLNARPVHRRVPIAAETSLAIRSHPRDYSRSGAFYFVMSNGH